MHLEPPLTGSGTDTVFCQHPSCDSADEYRALARSAVDAVLARMEARPTNVFNVTVLQRPGRDGRRFYQPKRMKHCLHDTISREVGILYEDVRVDVVSWNKATLEQQIHAASTSDLFMAAHGAGGINYVWQEPCSAFIDAFPFNHFSPHFYGPSAENMGLVYG